MILALIFKVVTQIKHCITKLPSLSKCTQKNDVCRLGGQSLALIGVCCGIGFLFLISVFLVGFLISVKGSVF